VLEIDIQHQLLFEKFEAFQAAHQQRKTSPEELYRLFWFIQAYALTHFKEEEDLMRRIGFPDFAQHRSQHLEFNTQIERFKGQLQASGFTQQIVTDIGNFISHWLVDHIATMDLAIGRYMTASDNGSPPP
jgi:hemerythrin